MILQSLYDLYERLSHDEEYQIAPTGYSLQRIHFKVVISPTGELFDVQDARIEMDGKRVPRRCIVHGGSKPSGAVTADSVQNKVLPLRNDLPFLLGGRIQDADSGSRGELKTGIIPARMEFESFRRQHLAWEAEIDDPGFSAVCRFLERWNPEDVVGHPEWADIANGQGVFQIQGDAGFVHESKAVRKWWDARTIAAEQSGAAIAECLVTGETMEIARLHTLIKGVLGSNTSGAGIVGFNASAYESYGKTQSFNAPVSLNAAFRYTTALNALLDGPKRDKHRLIVGDTTVAFWTDRVTLAEDIFAQFAREGLAALSHEQAQDESTRQRLDAFLKAMREGRQAYTELSQDPEQTKFYILGLAPNAARLSVRFFHRGTLGELLDNLRKHFLDIGLAPQPAKGKFRGDPEFPPLWLLLAQTGREAKDIPPVLVGPLLRAIVTGAHYPEGMFAAVLRRLHADPVVNYARACVIKGYLNRNLGKELFVSLDRDRPDTSYRLGRLFAALEKTQKDALGETLNRTIRESYYGSASATPRTVFPRLLKTYQHHLAKLEGGSKVNREKLVQEILGPLTDFPAHLGLADQGLFALGYYHEMQEFYVRKGDRVADSTERSSA